MNDTMITPNEITHAYRAYIETMLNYGEDAKRSHLTLVFFYPDTEFSQ